MKQSMFGSLAQGLFDDPNSRRSLDFSPFSPDIPEFEESIIGDAEDRVWHYTDLGGFLGITRARSIWASSIFHMNDASEMQHAYELFPQIAQEYGLANRSRLFDRFFKNFFQRIPPAAIVYPFIACFCEKEDQLSQWRAYGGAREKFCIGFDGNYLRTLALNLTRTGWQGDLLTQGFHEDAIFHFIRVIYDDEKKKKIIRTFLEQFRLFLRINKLDVGDQEVFGRLSFFVSLIIAHFGVVFKHPRFHEEAEWRLVCVHRNFSDSPSSILGKPISFREALYGLTPYIIVELDRHGNEHVKELPIEEIVLGPSMHAEILEKTVKKYLFESGLAHIGLRRSRIPLR